MEYGIQMALSFQRGEQKGFEHFFNAFYDPLCKYGYRFLEDMEAAEDIVERAFMVTWEKRENFDHHLVIKDYLYVCVKNGCLNAIDKQKVFDKNKEEINKYEIARLSSSEADHTLIRSEVKSIVYSWLKKLPPECAKIMKLMYVDGLTAREIANHLELNISTVKNQKANGLEFIKGMQAGKYRKKEPTEPPPELAKIVFIEVPKAPIKEEKKEFVPWRNRKKGRPKEEEAWWSPNEKYEQVYEMSKMGATIPYLARIFELSESHIANILVNERKSEKLKELFGNGKKVKDVARITHLSVREAIERINHFFKLSLNEQESSASIATYQTIQQNNKCLQGEERPGNPECLEEKYG